MIKNISAMHRLNWKGHLWGRTAQLAQLYVVSDGEQSESAEPDAADEEDEGRTTRHERPHLVRRRHTHRDLQNNALHIMP